MWTEGPHANLSSFLQLSPGYPNLIVLKSVKRTLEEMAANDEFMDAIREDMEYGQEQELDEEELAAMDSVDREQYLNEMQRLQEDQEMEDD